MSDVVYPVLAGLTFPVTIQPMFSTIVETGVDMSELRSTYMAAPVYDIILSYDVLRQRGSFTEFDTLVGFFKSRLGAWDSFLFDNPDDDIVNAQVFGTGDGNTANFQLMRSQGNFNEPVAWLNGNATVTVNNSPANYSIGSTGVVTFTSPPSGGSVLRWTGAFYYRARFKDDMAEFSKFMYKLYELGQVTLRATLGTKIR